MNVKISDDTESFDQWRKRLNRQIEEGLAQLDSGEGIPGEQAFRVLREKSRTRNGAYMAERAPR